MRSIVYHQAAGKCTLKRDDIPLLSQWIKKFDKTKLVEFLKGGRKRYFGEFSYGLEPVRKINAFRILASKSRRSRGYHPQLVAVYHQCEALYIIKPQEDARWRVMRYSPKGADDIRMYISPRASYTFNDMPSLRLE